MSTRPDDGLADGAYRAVAVAILVAAAAVVPATTTGASPPGVEAAEVPPRPLDGISTGPRNDPAGPLRRASAAPGPGGEEAEARAPAEGLLTTPVADAGDDQIGLVGRQITLNGSRSRPRGGIAYRWFQVGGPRAVAMAQDRGFLAFTPASAGSYRFGLVVAAEGAISEVDTVEVLVGSLPPASPRGGPESPAPPPPPIDEFARSALAAIEGGTEAARPLASTFEALCRRMDLYRTYADVFSEMSRRLDAFIPEEASRRAVWVDRLFTPLTARLVEQMRAEGLDLAQPEGAARPMTGPQKAKLADVFSSMAKGFRAASPPD